MRDATIRPVARVMVVDDDADLAEMLGIVLRSEGMDAVFCYNGRDAVAALRGSRPDLVLLDLMLPGMDGLAVCRAMRAESAVPIVMLTARGDTADVIAGLEAGADDYIVKPFKPGELVARINARLRRVEAGQADAQRIGDLDIDTARHCVSRGDSPIPLTPLEFDLLTAFAARPDHVFPREELLRDVWGYLDAGDTRLVNVHVQRLRGKVERDPDHPQIVVTVRGVGYRAGPA